jgi:hypothetical protein
MPDRVRVRRTGGFIGRAVEGSLDLAGPEPDLDDRVPEVRRLLERVDLRAVPAGKTWPDMYSFTFELDDRTATVPEHLLTPDLRRLAELLLDQSR